MSKSARSAGAVAVAFALAAVLVMLPTGGYARASHVQARTGRVAFLRSPAGASVDFSTGPSLFVMHANGSGLRRLTPHGTSVLAYAWSPDRRLIAYIDANTLSLWLVRPDGSGRGLLLPTSRLSSAGLSWSPDSRNLAIVSSGPDANLRNAGCPGMSLYVVPVNGAAPARLPAGHHVCFDVAWSPRGDEIAYSGTGIWTIRPDGTNRRQVSRFGGGSLQWSSDSAQLAFNVAFPMRTLRTNRYRAFAAVNA